MEFEQLTDGDEYYPPIRIFANEDTVCYIINSATNREAFTKGINALDDGTVNIEIDDFLSSLCSGPWKRAFPLL
ncbi:MAG: hypothetical protein MIO92_14055 [Methanosarcinaceae archaeon]|nr:hypothetical protein [Methanosarcinaceae archaeon]